MIIKKLAKLVKDAHFLGIVVMKDFGQEQQWLGGAWGAYDISDLPDLTFDQACTMFDYSAKTIDKISNEEMGLRILVEKAKAACQYRKYESDEIETHSTFVGDDEVKVFVDKGQTTFAFILASHLSPIVEDEYTYKALVKGIDGDTYLIVFKGLQPVAIIPTLPLARGSVECWQKSQATIYTCMSIYLNSLISMEERGAESGSDEESQYTLDEDEGTEDTDDAE